MASREKSNRQMEATINIKRYGTKSSLCLLVRRISANPVRKPDEFFVRTLASVLKSHRKSESVMSQDRKIGELVNTHL